MDFSCLSSYFGRKPQTNSRKHVAFYNYNFHFDKNIKLFFFLQYMLQRTKLILTQEHI